MRIIKYLLLLINICLTNFANAADVRITHLENLNAGTWLGTDEDIVIEDDICIYSDTGSYQITAEGSGAASEFRLSNGSNYIEYKVNWNDTASTSSGQEELTKLVTKTNQTTTETTSNNCNQGANLTAHLQIRFLSSELQKRKSGNYSGVLTLTIGAN